MRARRTLVAFFSLLMILAFAGESWCGTDLGNALNFGIISTGGTVTLNSNSLGLALPGLADSIDIGGRSIKLNDDVNVSGDLIASTKGISLGANSKAANCITAGAGVSLGAGSTCATDTSGTSTELTTLLPNAIADIGKYVAAAQAEPVTTAMAPIKLEKSQLQEIDTTVSGFNVITTPSLTVADSGTIEIGGSAGDQLVMVIKGNLNLGAGASLHTIPPLIKTNLVVIVLGKKVTLHGGALITGTLIAPNASCTAFRSMTVVGAIFCGKNIFFGTPSTVSLDPSLVVLP